MSETYTVKALLTTVKEGLRDIGYRDDLLREKYGFVDILAQDQLREIEFAAFAQEPPSYRNACIGVTVPSHDSPEAIQVYRALGAPQILSLHPQAHIIRRWKIPAQGNPIPIGTIEPSELYTTIQAHRDEWSPERVLRAKSIGFASDPIQLDFFDIGLLPTLEELVHSKLGSLLEKVIASSESVYKEYHHDKDLDYRALFRLIFRLIAAKVLGDRQYPGNWLSSNTQEVIRAVEAFYFQGMPTEPVLNNRIVQDEAWRSIRTAFSFQNLSVEALAYVYETTLVSPETRKEYGTHATASQVAEYIVNSLPFEELAIDERHVFEPFCGHAPFLTAALGRLRALLSPDMNTRQRHNYFIQMLSGIDLDSFACEVALNSLILADYPNPNGWRIKNSDVFTSLELTDQVKRAQVVLCNPPFEDFQRGERHIFSTNKAVEALLLVLRESPKMLGFVLPRSFVDGRRYRKAQQQIENLYNNISLVALPDNAFNYSEAETVLLIAHGQRTAQPARRSALVEKNDYQRFIRTGEPTWQREMLIDQAATKVNLWHSRLEHLWDVLAHLPRLGEFADIHTGIQYIHFEENASHLVSDEPRTGFAPGLLLVADGFEPYVPGPFKYLNMDPKYMRRQAYKFPWNKPKVITNAARKSRGPWTITAAIDEQGLACYENFDGIWPAGDMPLEVIAALLNGPVANAFLSSHRTTRRNKIETIKRIPIPKLRPSFTHLIVSLVRSYCSYRKQWLEQPEQAKYFEGCCRGIMRQIEDELLTAYDLPLQLERELIKYFEGIRRPGPATLTGVDASYTKELFKSIMRVENIGNEDGNKVVEVEIMNWDSDELARFPLSLVPASIQDKVFHNIWLFAKVNIGAERAQDLVFEDIELAPELDPNDELA